jgi:DNA-binding LytR/AlgR family response regulator
MEARLPSPPFRRIHRAIIINTDHIRSIAPLSSRRFLLRLTGGLEAIVSRRMAGAIREATRW